MTMDEFIQKYQITVRPVFWNIMVFLLQYKMPNDVHVIIQTLKP